MKYECGNLVFVNSKKYYGYATIVEIKFQFDVETDRFLSEYKVRNNTNNIICSGLSESELFLFENEWVANQFGL